MQRREFMLKTAASLAVGSLVAGCKTTTTTSTVTAPGSAKRDDRSQLDAGVETTLTRLYGTAPEARELVSKASGVLVFPNVIAAGFGIGGEYGKGALRIKGVTSGYYSLTSLSVGLQVGAQSKAIIFLIMTQDALDRLRSSPSWSAGIDASVAIVRVGANGAIDTTTTTGPVLAFILTNAGLMANLSLEGTRIKPLEM